ncbi:MAG TPA: hypothetical protein VF763_07070 [Candidatus Limnocylindrales bacterium]
MSDSVLLLALLVACAIGIGAVLLILRRQRSQEAAAHRESPFAASTEGMKVCPSCGRPNLWTDATCLYCGNRLPA